MNKIQKVQTVVSVIGLVLAVALLVSINYKPQSENLTQIRKELEIAEAERDTIERKLVGRALTEEERDFVMKNRMSNYEISVIFGSDMFVEHTPDNQERLDKLRYIESIRVEGKPVYVDGITGEVTLESPPEPRKSDIRCFEVRTVPSEYGDYILYREEEPHYCGKDALAGMTFEYSQYYVEDLLGYIKEDGGEIRFLNGTTIYSNGTRTQN